MKIVTNGGLYVTLFELATGPECTLLVMELTIHYLEPVSLVQFIKRFPEVSSTSSKTVFTEYCENLSLRWFQILNNFLQT